MEQDLETLATKHGKTVQEFINLVQPPKDKDKITLRKLKFFSGKTPPFRKPIPI